MSEAIPKNDDTDGERKTVTALFADIKGSTELMAELDPEEARRIVDPALKSMIEAVRRYDGYIVQSTGDGILRSLRRAGCSRRPPAARALRGFADAGGDAPLRRTTMRRERGKHPSPGWSQCRRCGGPLDSDRREKIEYTPIGHSISLASRLQTLANPCSIAITDGLRKLVEGYFTLKPLGPARIRGSSEPVNVYEVMLGPLRTRLQRAAGRGLHAAFELRHSGSVADLRDSSAGICARWNFCQRRGYVGTDTEVG